jgi:hypothetical protein
MTARYLIVVLAAVPAVPSPDSLLEEVIEARVRVFPFFRTHSNEVVAFQLLRRHS